MQETTSNQIPTMTIPKVVLPTPIVRKGDAINTPVPKPKPSSKATGKGMKPAEVLLQKYPAFGKSYLSSTHNRVKPKIVQAHCLWLLTNKEDEIKRLNDKLMSLPYGRLVEHATILGYTVDFQTAKRLLPELNLDFPEKFAKDYFVPSHSYREFKTDDQNNGQGAELREVTARLAPLVWGQEFVDFVNPKNPWMKNEVILDATSTSSVSL
jgi:hypothetical protein